MIKKGLSLLLLSIMALNLSAATLENVNLPDKVTVEGKELVLNGMGVRKATFLKIKVYIGALYLEQKSKAPNTFLGTSSPKQVIMHFVRDVSVKKLKDAFTEGMERANKNFAQVKPSFDEFNSKLADMVNNELIVISFLNDGVLVSVKGKPAEKISGTEFSKALLNIWFTNPVDESLKNGLLGL